MPRDFQGLFNGGILSPSMYSRTDVSKFRSGLKDAVNVNILAEGGVENRAGTSPAVGFDTSISGGAQQWLIPFEFSVDDTYMLEFGENGMVVLKGGAPVLDSTVAAQSISSISDANPAVITMVSGAAAANFSVDDLAYVQDPNGTHFLHNQIVRVTAVSTADISFEVYDQTAIDTTTNTTALGAGATLSKVYVEPHPYTLADLPQVDYAQDVDTLYLVHEDYDVRTLQRISDDDWVFAVAAFAPAATPPPDTAPAAYLHPVLNATQADPVVVTTVLALGSIEDGDTVYISGVGGMTEINNRVFVAKNPTATTFELYEVDGNTSVDGTGYTAFTSVGAIRNDLGAARNVGTGTTPYRYQVAAVVDGEESLPSDVVSTSNDLTTVGNQNIIFWTPVAGAESYVIYKDENGAFGYIGTSEGRSFIDENIIPDTTQAPQVERNPFDGVGNKPSVVTFIEQRLACAATINNPQVVEMSQSVNPLNFNRSTFPVDSDAISFRVRSQQLNRIVALIASEPHIMLTTGAEWSIDGGDQKGYLTPTNPIVRPRKYRGSARYPKPLLIGETVLHVQGDGRTIRELILNSQGPSPDMTLLARHLFKGKTVTSWTYAQAPNSIVWLTLDDGTLLSMTYLVEHEVWGWTRHTLGGTNAKALQVSSVREGSSDVVYLVTSRTVNGTTVRMTERMNPRVFTAAEDAYFVDAGYQTTLSTPASELRGYLHLRGEDATVLADGSVLSGLSFDAFGILDLGVSTAEEKIAAGLGYQSYITTLGVDFGAVQGMGSLVGRYKATSEIAIQVEDTRGIAASREGGPLTEVKEYDEVDPIPLQTTTHLINVEGDWVRDARVTVIQQYPLPMRITGVAPDWEMEDG